ncbi:MAG: hypothetical protein RBS43_02405 [Candidatus Cloacimonas sp.]|nr:hypothetical protein [Candidatus Cloacimonas sp.]
MEGWKGGRVKWWKSGKVKHAVKIELHTWNTDFSRLVAQDLSGAMDAMIAWYWIHLYQLKLVEPTD